MDPKQKKGVRALPPYIFLGVVLVAAFFLTWFLFKKGSARLDNDAHASVSVISNAITQSIRHARSTAGSLAGSPWIAPALMTRSDADIRNANSVLDRYQSSFDYAVCYLLDDRGDVVASSNRNASDSFVGENYAFRPYFQEAIEGKPSFYAALGVTSKERGFYTAYPVTDSQRNVIGIVVIKDRIEGIRNILLPNSHAFYASPEGVIFISSDPSLVLKSLRPLTDAEREKIRKSEQFGPGPFEPLFDEKFEEGRKVRFKDQNFRCFLVPLDPPGWGLVYLAPMAVPEQYFWFGIVISLFACGLAVSFIVWSRSREKDLARILENEERFAAAMKSSAIGIALVGLDGKWLQVNRSLCLIVGYSEEELLRKNFQDITHPDDLEADLGNARRLLDGEIQDYQMEKRYLHKDGHIVWIRLSGSLVRDPAGKPLYFIAQIEDIGERKKAEKRLKDKMEELARFNRIAIGRELKMIELKEKIKKLQEGKQ